MNNILNFAALLIGLVLTSCNLSKPEKQALATIEGKSGTNTSGTVLFEQKEDKVVMTAKISGLTEGKHAIHIHQIADCTSADAKSAGGHWNPTGEDHGEWSEDQFHMGDIGNLVADKDGNATLTFETDKWCVACDDLNKNVVRHAVVIHAGVDDFTSQPSGAAGARVGCGEIVNR